MNWELQSIGYTLAALAFSILALMFLTRWRGRLHHRLLTITLLICIVWSITLAYAVTSANLSQIQLLLIEAVHDGTWLVFLVVLLGGAEHDRSYRYIRYAGLALGFLLVVIVGFASFKNFAESAAHFSDRLIFSGSILTSLYALVLVEQIYRNSRLSQRSSLKFLCLGIGTIFSYDLFLYTEAMLSNTTSDLLWNARGYVVFMCVPLIGIAAHRSSATPGGIVASRHIAFYSAILVTAVAYIAIVGFSGYYIRQYGGNWGAAVQLVFFAAAILTFSVLLISDHVRSVLRVFITKHFYESKYDFRAEWLRLIDTLTTGSGELSLNKRAIKALVQVVDAPSGHLWLKSVDKSDFLCVAGWNSTCSKAVLDENHSIVRFLENTGWIVDLREFRRSPDHYRNLAMDDGFEFSSDVALIVPLLHDERLLGFVTMEKSQTLTALNFEDHDLLRTAGRQVASYIAQEIATEQLAENRQFEAFSRLTAFLMHDLKNVVAQQLLVVENAQKHRNNPEFIDDAIDTIGRGVIRLRRIIEHLQQRSQSERLDRIELGKLALQVVSQCSDREPVPRVISVDKPIWVWAERERLIMAIYHVVRNAQDATPPNGEVTIGLEGDDNSCTITVVDSGSGMSEEFIRERLYRPFDSTKGTKGMGIGAHQMRETVRSLGGVVVVNSAQGKGTSIEITLTVGN